jgi:hypothetical protein
MNLNKGKQSYCLIHALASTYLSFLEFYVVDMVHLDRTQLNLPHL